MVQFFGFQMLKFFASLLIVLLGALVWVETRIIVLNDLSTLPLNKENLVPRGVSSSGKKGVYLVSYADGPEIFFKNQHALTVSALNRGIDFILNYRRPHLDPIFVKKNQAILNQKKGAGFWLWKPWVIHHTLMMVPENAYVIYADTGFVFTGSVLPYLKRMEGKDIMLIAYDSAVDGPPVQIAKRDIFARLNCDHPACWKGTHVWAGFLMLRNTAKARLFIKEWLDLCCDEVLLTDRPGLLAAHADQKSHQHDEAILSVLYNTKINQGDSHLTLLPIHLFRTFTFWHHRHPGKEYESLWHKSTPPLRGVERDWVLNAPWFKKIRQFYYASLFL